jgi:hypothetical protein
MAAIMRERNSNSRIAFQATAEGGAQTRVLDFEFLSRSAQPRKQWIIMLSRGARALMALA